MPLCDCIIIYSLHCQCAFAEFLGFCYYEYNLFCACVLVSTFLGLGSLIGLGSLETMKQHSEEVLSQNEPCRKVSVTPRLHQHLELYLLILNILLGVDLASLRVCT